MKNTSHDASPGLMTGRKASPDSLDVTGPKFGLSSNFEGVALLSDVSLQVPASRFVTFCPHLIFNLLNNS